MIFDDQSMLFKTFYFYFQSFDQNYIHNNMLLSHKQND